MLYATSPDSESRLLPPLISHRFLILTHVLSGRTVLPSPAAFAVKPHDWPTSERTELWLPQPGSMFIPSTNTCWNT